MSYTGIVPKLWSQTIEGHRAAVRDATLDATAALVAERGLSSVTMSEVASSAGIGRATLYKYFPDVDSILTAWHERQVGEHLARLTEIRERGTDVHGQLVEVLTAFAFMNRGPHDDEVSALLHQGRYVTTAHQRLHGLIEDLIVGGVGAGDLRADVPPTELASYCLHALASAGSLSSKAAVHRLVGVTLAGITAQRS
ncbi:MAG: transcriptional regulator, TetR family [Marmoricola sp.]|nr:transcriptional regulator, TetR family [Marmoricola sp.]